MTKLYPFSFVICLNVSFEVIIVVLPPVSPSLLNGSYFNSPAISKSSPLIFILSPILLLLSLSQVAKT